MNTSTGTSVVCDAIILENQNLRSDRQHKVLPRQIGSVVVPPGHRQGGVPKADYENYRLGLDSACADAVVCTVLPDGQYAVLAVKRAPGSVFGGLWWMQGGAVHAYRSVMDFLAERTERECGVRPIFEAVIGVYRTCAPDGICSTTQPCFVASASYEAMVAARPDRDHTATRFLTLRDLEQIPAHEQHWYPMRVFRLALESMPSSG